MPYLFLFFALTLLACSSSKDSDDNREREHNYRLLKAYFYKPELIKKYSSYEGMEIDAMYETLHDTLGGWRYTRYHKPDIAQQVIDDTENSDKYYSFGFERKLESDTLVVNAVYPNSPANSAGLKKHDKLLFANDQSLTGETAVAYEESDSVFSANVTFKVLRGEENLTLDAMQKMEVLKPTVYLDSINDVPLIRVTEFTKNTNDPNGTYQEFKNALRKIQGAKTAIIDLRRNPGGSIHHCTAMAAELALPEKELVYDIVHYYDRTRGNVIDTAHYYAKDFSERNGYGVDIKWILLISRFSASCAERFAAAVKASRPESKLIGGVTYGKGIGQYYITTYLKGVAFITAIETFYPNGEPFHRIGVKPDIKIDSIFGQEIYLAALDAAQDFGLAKRLPIVLKKLPPERSVRKMEPKAYKEILLHEGEQLDISY
ncbi:MAG: PDZ domain-containing protein [Fibromonadaceae bacterium]|jgi:C-terminal peptidase prc|nr:PDZ domain-containing protein [Fibromonadaceae bacterium]